MSCKYPIVLVHGIAMKQLQSVDESEETLYRKVCDELAEMGF